MASDKKKAKKAKKAAKAEKAERKAAKAAGGATKKGTLHFSFDIPKEIGTIQVPEELRNEGKKLIDALKGVITAEVTAAAFSALAKSAAKRQNRTH